MKYTFASLLLLACVSPAFAEPPEGGPAGGWLGHGGRGGLEDMDQNKDGKITKAEAQAARLKMFDAHDSNKDGVFSKEEMMSRRAKAWERMTAKIDTNKDGKISRTEFAAGPTPLFDRVDANKDGVIDETEIASMKAKREARKGPPPGSGPQ